MTRIDIYKNSIRRIIRQRKAVDRQLRHMYTVQINTLILTIRKDKEKKYD